MAKTDRTSKKTGKLPAKKDAAKTLQNLFLDGIKDLYWAEKALTKAMPKLIQNATSARLKTAIKDHLDQTHGQVKRLEACFASMGRKPQAKKCDAMAGILEEGKGIMEETEPGAVRDAGIIAASQKVEHYEIASYGTMAAFAKVLGERACLKLLLATLSEEKKCDEKLTRIADTALNSTAV